MPVISRTPAKHTSCRSLSFRCRHSETTHSICTSTVWGKVFEVAWIRCRKFDTLRDSEVLTPVIHFLWITPNDRRLDASSRNRKPSSEVASDYLLNLKCPILQKWQLRNRHEIRLCSDGRYFEFKPVCSPSLFATNFLRRNTFIVSSRPWLKINVPFDRENVVIPYKRRAKIQSNSVITTERGLHIIKECYSNRGE